MVAPTAGAVCVGPIWAMPSDPRAEFPPPICTLPVELEAVLPPLPPIVTGTVAPAVFPAAPTEADGVELTELTCTLPVELVEVLPPPTCTEPTDPDALLSPEPPIDVGADTDVELVSTVGVTATVPV